MYLAATLFIVLALAIGALNVSHHRARAAMTADERAADDEETDTNLGVW